MYARTRPSHAALHGLVLSVDDPFWDKHMPPGWAWFCRCHDVKFNKPIKKPPRSSLSLIIENQKIIPTHLNIEYGDPSKHVIHWILF